MFYKWYVDDSQHLKSFSKMIQQPSKEKTVKVHKGSNTFIGKRPSESPLLETILGTATDWVPCACLRHSEKSAMMG